MNHRATPALSGAMSPKSTSRLGTAPSPFTSDPMISKATSRPCSFSMILGWLELILSFLAAPKPLLATRTPRVKGSGGSVAGV